MSNKCENEPTICKGNAFQDLSTFLNLSNKEYNILSNICNIYSQLTHSITPSPSSSKIYHNPSLEVLNLQIDLQNECKKLRNTHRELEAFASNSQKEDDDCNEIGLLLKEHVNLSERVIRTCTKDCVMDEYWVMCNLGKVSHDVKIVALTSLQASIRNLEYLDKK